MTDNNDDDKKVKEDASKEDFAVGVKMGKEDAEKDIKEDNSKKDGSDDQKKDV